MSLDSHKNLFTHTHTKRGHFMPENGLEDENLLVTLNFIIFYSTI